MRYLINFDNLKLVKVAARAALPEVGSSHLSEALAAGFGYKNNAALRKALKDGTATLGFDDSAVAPRLAVVGASIVYSPGLLASVLTSVPSIQVRPSDPLERLRAAVEKMPRLTYSGISEGIGRFAHHKTQGEFDEARQNLLSPGAVDEFLAAEEWLALCGKRQKPFRKVSSYGFKHQIEKRASKLGLERGSYIANGVFIAAAISCGFDVHSIDGGPNAHLNIASVPTVHPEIVEILGSHETYRTESAAYSEVLVGAANHCRSVRGTLDHLGRRRSIASTVFDLGLKSLGLVRNRLSVNGWNWTASLEVGIDAATGHLVRQSTAVTIRGDVDAFAAWVSG
ncbi:hypothetical protein HUE56_06565 (plasmid) [Azospirillum oryzae]|uniref:Uncharacterized protein n=1 Tax=Azospirillum oryzae TaxID=286727 RepID=A0A6N1AER0_9PROT|nr:hypothetical protein [Azospirillum oryzae]KAA0588829.1 hypothetical protein FZ938_13310 [Azospirillum oryzae]QKS50175.1 hypothetical protein HUE56_06565 [Azospirillum oryzae]GLR80257.1 hypothetical protein GCM10007856_29350 [Azospirillum oryzae]